MPAPRRMPRTPVSRESLQRIETPPRIVTGPAAIIDGEKLRIGDTDLRLFGVVPPQLAASFGPQARSALDTLAGGQSVSCQVRDRDRDGRLLATCHASNGNDMALELLRRGLAVTARGSIAGTDLSAPYLAAEQAAQTQKIGLWSVNMPAAGAFTAAVAPPPAALHAESAALPSTHEERTATPRNDKSNIADALPTPVAAPQAAATPTPSTAEAKITDDLLEQQKQAHADEDRYAGNNFFLRYQFIIAGFLMFATALTIVTALWLQKRRDKRDETKAVAAALRGELMAARGVCIGRIKSINNDEEDRAATWPRIRSTLYQAYVGRLGLLGAELARQVASIYGQCSDYASLYSPTGTARDASKKTALESLARHIDEILPKLAGIEQNGFLLATAASATSRQIAPQPRSRYDAPSLPRAAKQPMLQGNYKTIAAPATPAASVASPAPKPEKTEADAAYHATNITPQHATIPQPLSPAALWESVRGFIQNHRNAIVAAEPPMPHDPHAADYAAMIEADMARYPYTDNSVETYDLNPQKKRG